MPRGELRGHEAAVTAAEHPDPIGVAEAVALQRDVEHGQHVVDVDRAPAGARRHGVLGSDDRLTPCRVPAATTPGVAHQHDEAGGGLHLGLVEERLAVLRERPAVHVEQHGVLAASLEPLRSHDPGVDLPGAVARRNGELLPAEQAAGHGGDGAIEGHDLGGMLDRRLGHGDPAAGGVEGLHGDRPRGDAVWFGGAVGGDLVEVRLATVLHRRQQHVVVQPDGRAESGERRKRAIEGGRDPPVAAPIHRHEADLDVLRKGGRVIRAQEGDHPAVR